MSKAKIHVGDVGTRVLIRIRDQDGDPFPLDEAEVLTAKFVTPGGDYFERDLEDSTDPDHDPDDGWAEYIFQEGEVAESGLWEVEVRVVTLHGSWTSTDDSFRVWKTL